MSDRAEDTVIVISGGSRGFGRGLAAEMLEDGFRVATFSRKESPFVRSALRDFPERFLWEPVDGTDGEAIRSFTRAVIQRFGRIDALINNAAAGTDGILTLMPEADIHTLVSLNLEAVILLTRACLKSMMEQGRGCIVNISSVNAIRGHAGVSVYSATKAALDGLTRSLAREVGSLGIRVNSVAPGYFESDMSHGLREDQKKQLIRRTPLGRMGTVSDMVGAIRFLISENAGFITGQTLVVDGGLTC